jgi:hypothetical protein
MERHNNVVCAQCPAKRITAQELIAYDFIPTAVKSRCYPINNVRSLSIIDAGCTCLRHSFAQMLYQITFVVSKFHCSKPGHGMSR